MNHINFMRKGVNYIEMWMDKKRLDEIGENNIDTEYFEDNLITGEEVIYDFMRSLDEGYLDIKLLEDNEMVNWNELS